MPEAKVADSPIDAATSPLSTTDATIQNTSSPTSPTKQPELIRLQLIPWSTIPMIKPVLSELVERRVREGQSFKIGRQVSKEIAPGAPIPIPETPNPLDVWFISKVVSRVHAEFSIKEGVIYIRDVGSSSGTFLNKMRLSPTTKESKPFVVKEGDIIQFGVDYKGRPDDVYKSITVRIGFYDQSWVHAQRKKANPTKFRTAMISLLNSTNTNPDNQREESETPECCICYEETGPFQALFLAPCSHCYHYKCVSNIIVQSAMFQCPLCRQVANLTASVSNENLPSVIDSDEVAIGAKGDPKKFLQAAQAIETARAAADAAAVVAAHKQKKRAGSFTARISTIFRRSSNGANSSSVIPTGLISTAIPGSSSPLRMNNDPEVANDDGEEAVAQIALNAATARVQTSTGLQAATDSKIPRSATVNTFEDGEDEGTNAGASTTAPLHIPITIQESSRELNV